MRFGGGWRDWLTAASGGGGEGDGMEVWLNNAAIASAVVIAASNVFLARVLFQVYRRRADHVRAPRALVLFAGILALCGASHLALLRDRPTALRAASVGLRWLAAGLWVTAAIRFPEVLDRVAHPRSGGHPHELAPSLGAATAALGLVESELTRVNQRLRALESLIRSDAAPSAGDGDGDPTSHGLREALDEMKAGPCKT